MPAQGLLAQMKLLARAVTYPYLFTGWHSMKTFGQIYHPRFRRGPLPDTATLKVRVLDNHPITIRTKGSDPGVLFSVCFHQAHVQPPELVPRTARLILDLGANIGCTMAHLACLYPQATIIGVELDEDTAQLCRANVAPWGERCRVVTGAVWSEDGEIEYEVWPENAQAMMVRQDGAAPNYQVKRAPALSLNSLLRTLPPDSVIDYVKMDIESAEREVLRKNTAWAARVRCLKAEIHSGYSQEEALADLRALGFEAWAESKHEPCVVGIRR